MKTTEALYYLRPKAQWVLRDEDYDTLVWLDENVPKPTKEEVLRVIEKFSYADKRKAEYPPLSEQLDALWKGEPYVTQMKEQILKIKEKYPKPE